MKIPLNALMQREISASASVTAVLRQTLSFGIHTWPRCPAPIPTVHTKDSASQNDAFDHSAILVVLTSYHESQIDETKNRRCANMTGRTKDYTDIYDIYKTIYLVNECTQTRWKMKGPRPRPQHSASNNHTKQSEEGWAASLDPLLPSQSHDSKTVLLKHFSVNLLICPFYLSTAGNDPSDI